MQKARTKILLPEPEVPYRQAARMCRPWLGCVPALILSAWAAPPASGQDLGRHAPTPHQLCESAIVLAGQEARLPASLAMSIARVESGRLDLATGRARPWPWTINSDGLGSYFKTKEDAVAAASALRARGVRSMDIGCMQVNLRHHPQAFADLHEAFDPLANVRYAARFLLRLHRQTGDWTQATAFYHSQTRELGEEYARKVLGPWPLAKAAPARLQRLNATALPEAPAIAPSRPMLTGSELLAMERGVPGLACPINRC